MRGDYAHVYLNEPDLARLAAHVGMTARDFRRRYTVRDELGWTELDFSERCCPFLNEPGGRCSVYTARPTQCRTFPFWREFVQNEEWTPAVHALCEGIGEGPVHAAEKVEALMREQEAVDEDESP